jgi:CDP-glucose 4,6-dehydratase
MTYWLDRPVLITGATGIVGACLTQKLSEAGADVVIIARDYIPRSQLVRSGTWHKVRRVTGDINNRELIERTVSEYEIDTVFHLAAQTCVPIANKTPYPTFQTNIMGSVNILEACRLANVRRLIVSSSDKAYGDKGKAYTEDMPLFGEHPYDVSKSSQDMIAQAYGHSYGMNIAIARCGNIYGAGDLNWSRLIPGTIRRLLRGQPPRIYSDGKMMRDYFYVDDTARAYKTLGESDLTGAFNFGGGQPYTVQEVVDLIENLMDIYIPPVYQGTTNEIDSQWLDITKAKEKLGFEPLFNLRDGLVRTIEWYRSYFDE